MIIVPLLWRYQHLYCVSVCKNDQIIKSSWPMFWPSYRPRCSLYEDVEENNSARRLAPPPPLTWMYKLAVKIKCQRRDVHSGCKSHLVEHLQNSQVLSQTSGGMKGIEPVFSAKKLERLEIEQYVSAPQGQLISSVDPQNLITLSPAPTQEQRDHVFLTGNPLWHVGGHLKRAVNTRLHLVWALL